VTRLERHRQRLDRIDFAVIVEGGIERLERADGLDQVDLELGVIVGLQLGGEKIGQLAQEARVAGQLGVVLNQAGQLERRPPVSRGLPQSPHRFHRITLTAGQFAEEQPD